MQSKDESRNAALRWEGTGRLDFICVPGQPRSAQTLLPAGSSQATQSVEAPEAAPEADALPMATALWVIPGDAQAAPQSQGTGWGAAAAAASASPAAQVSHGLGA